MGTSPMPAARSAASRASPITSEVTRRSSAPGRAAIAAYRCTSSPVLLAVVFSSTTTTPMRPPVFVRRSGT